jgi:predicted Zn-dependent peptidase
VSYNEGGTFAVYGGTSPDTFAQVLDLVHTEMDKVCRNSLSADEVSKAKTQIRGALVLGLENMSGRMMRMGKSILYFGKVLPLEEILAKIDAVSLDDIGQVANELFHKPGLPLAAIGPFPSASASA